MTDEEDRKGKVWGAKDLMALIGFAGNLVGFLAGIPGWYSVILCLLSSLFILIWGFIEKTNDEFSLKAALARLALIVGAILLVFFAGVGAELISVSANPPSAFGTLLDQEANEFQISSSKRTAQVAGVYDLTFTRNADIAEVSVMPSAEDGDLIGQLSITTTGPLQDTSRMTELLNKRTSTQMSFRVQMPSQSFRVALHSTVELKTPRSAPNIRMTVHCKYGSHNWHWRFSKWVYEKYAE